MPRRGQALRPPRPRRGTVTYADAILAVQTRELAAIGVQARGEGAWMDSATSETAMLAGRGLYGVEGVGQLTCTNRKLIILHNCLA